MTTFTRGRSKPTVNEDLFDHVEQLVGNRDGDLEALKGRSWDAVIDNSGYRVQWATDSAELLRDAVDLYLYTSSIGVYYPYTRDVLLEDDVLNAEIPPEDTLTEVQKLEYGYAVMKTLSEREVVRIIGEDRLVVFDQPGTTRDSVSVPFEKNDRKYELIDTAGIRRKSKVHEAIEKFSIVKALQAIDRAEVVIAVLDAHEGVTEQDVSLLGLVLERGRSLVIVTNKWDGITAEQRKHVRDQLDRRLPFLDFAERITISALHGTAVGDVLPAVALVGDLGRHVLNDGTLEGLAFLDVPAFGVQFHPEAAPGPRDSTGLFDRFIDLMESG